MARGSNRISKAVRVTGSFFYQRLQILVPGDTNIFMGHPPKFISYARTIRILSCLCDDVKLLALVHVFCVFFFLLEVKVVAERSPIQTAAILICLTGKRGDNLPLQLLTRGGEGGKVR